MPDLFYPALLFALVIWTVVLLVLITPYEEKSLARGDRTGEVIGSSPPRPPVG